MVLGIMTGTLRKIGSYTPLGNFTSKRGNKNFYKGKGGKKYGKPNSRGSFVLDRLPNWRIPDLSHFQLKAYVGKGEGLSERDTEKDSNHTTGS